MTITEAAPRQAQPPAPRAAIDEPVPVTRRRIDHVLVGLGTAFTAVLVAAGALLMWGSSFADDYVGRELSAQDISFPDEAALNEEGRTDLLRYAGEQVTTGKEAEAYASFIAGHVQKIGEGQTYAELGGPERAAKAAVTDAVANGAPPDEVAALEAKAAALTGQRDTIFRGEMLRGALLNTYAWSTMGRIAGIAAIVSFAVAAAMAVLVVLGLVHIRRTATH